MRLHWGQIHKNRPRCIAETGFILDIMPREQLKAYTERENDDQFIDIDERSSFPMTDEEARAEMKAITGCASASEFQRLAKHDREVCFRQLYRQGINIAQICRITGYTRPVIYKALKG